MIWRISPTRWRVMSSTIASVRWSSSSVASVSSTKPSTVRSSMSSRRRRRMPCGSCVGRGVERDRGRRAPVDRQQVVVRAPDGVAPDVERLVAVDAAEVQRPAGLRVLADALAPHLLERLVGVVVAAARRLAPGERGERDVEGPARLVQVCLFVVQLSHPRIVGCIPADDLATQPRQPQGRHQGLRRAHRAAGRHARRVGRRPDRRRRPQRRRQVDAAAADRGHRGAGRGRGHALGRAARADARPGRRPAPGPHDPRGARRRARRPRVARGRGVPQRARRPARRRGDRALPARGWTRRSRRSRGGERRRIALAKTLLDHPELLLLDEPTNHLDVEGVDWLARHLAARRGSMLVVTHDRWFLDAVCTHTWEVADTTVHQYEGGYAAYMLARAERARQAAAREERRQQLIRKELAWLRRGPPARTSKPKFRIEAANALIADEPEPRDKTELLRFSTLAPGQQGDRRRGRVDRLRRARCCCATRPGASARATASRSSASTARARRR